MSHVAATAAMKTGIASAWAMFNGPPRIAAAAASTRLPVTCAVKMLPSVKNPIRSTMPAITLSSGGSRSPKAESSALVAAVPSAVWNAGLFGRVGMVRCLLLTCTRRAIAEIVDGHFRNDKTEAHCQDGDGSDEAVGSRRVEQLQGTLTAAGNLQQAARHPEQVDAGYQRHHGSKANGRKRHMRSPRN